MLFLDLSKTLAPIAEATGLPSTFYTDHGAFNLEQRLIFARTWAGLGFAKDIPNAGDAMPYTFCGQPLVAIRGKDDVVRVFQNVCRHRGMILVDEKKHLKGVIRCPYHSWCYSHEGNLITTPHVGGPGINTHESIERENLGLIEVRSFIWHDVIFVNLDGKAKEFHEASSGLTKRWEEFSQPFYHSGDDSSFKLEIQTNWKLAIENYSESYHLPWVHPGLNAYSRLEDHYNIVEPKAYGGQGTHVYRQTVEDGRQFADFNNLSEKWDNGAEYITLFPNVMFGVHRDHVYAIIVEPIAADKTVEHIEIYYASEASLDDSYKDMRANNAALWKGVFIEDIFVVEGLQKGRAAAGFDGGRFSPVMDEATHAFHHWVATRLHAEDR